MERTPPTWTLFTKRTNDPKLKYLEARLDDAGIPHRRMGRAPILEVHRNRLDDAWELLDPIDDVPDDDPRWKGGAE